MPRKLSRRPARSTPRRAPSTSATGSTTSRVARVARGAKSAKPGKSVSRRGRASQSAVSSITPFLWFDNNFETAARFYVSLFPNSRLDGLNPMGGSFTLAGQRFMGLNGGPQYKFSPAVSFFVVCRDQAEVDRLWSAIEKGGKPSRCGWIDDKFGLTWQIIPEAFLRLTSGSDPKRTQAVFGAMMGMVKMDVNGLQAAYDAA